MSIRYKTIGRFRQNICKIVGALMLGAATIAGAQDPNSPAETSPSGPKTATSGQAADKTGSSNANAKNQAKSTERTSLELLRLARLRLDGYETLKADMVEVIEFGPRRFQAKGVYLRGTGHRLRLDLAVTLENSTGRLLQISDGDILWTVYDVGQTPRITRRDVTQILAAAEKSHNRGDLALQLGLGGLPALLAAVERSMVLEPPIVAEIDGRTFHVIQGTWKPAYLAQFQEQARNLPTPQKEPRPLPVHVPELVRIYLDAKTHFPYRIRYLKTSTKAGAEPRPILTLDFRNIVVEAPIDPTVFRYTVPDGANVADLTNYYLRQLRGGNRAPAAAQPASARPAPNSSAR